MGILDLVHGKSDCRDFLHSQTNLSDDLVALRRSLDMWQTGEVIDVGESGTLYRFLKYTAWKLGQRKQFILRGSLRTRNIADDPALLALSQEQLLALDNRTSQWASAAVLLGDTQRLTDPPHKLRVTYEAVHHWSERRMHGCLWDPRADQTIEKQAQAYVRIRNGKPVDFEPEQAEDFCFAYCFCGLSANEGEKRWPSLRGHESDRIVEMEQECIAASTDAAIKSRDHRIVQAIAMKSKIEGKKVQFLYPEAVNKTWPQFWEFLEQS